MTSIILAGGQITLTEALKTCCQAARLVIAADSGLHHAHALGVTPASIVGDFDSVSAEVLATYPELPRLEHPPEKDQLDLELALEEARARGATELIIVGGLGSRFDQSLAAALIAAKLKKQGVDVHLDSGDRQLYPLSENDTLALSTEPGRTFSVLSLSPTATLSIHGAKYPLEHYGLEFGSGLGVSNQTCNTQLDITLHQGLVVVMMEAPESP